MRWDGENSGGPRVLYSNDFDNIEGDYIFARKIDSLETMQAIIEKLKNK
jgi:hypothetical protein